MHVASVDGLTETERHLSDGEFREEKTASIFFKSSACFTLKCRRVASSAFLSAPPRRYWPRKDAQLPKCCIVDEPG